MAITHNGCQNLLSSSQIPSGYTRPTVTTISDYHYSRDLTLSIAKATVENATASTTMTNIIDDATIGIDKQIEDILAADFLASATVTSYANLTALTTNLASTTGSDVWLDNTAVSYVATVKLYVKAA